MNQLDQEAVYFKEAFGSESGQKALSLLEKFCGFNDSSVNEQEPDAYRTFYNEGKRRVYLRIQWYLDRKVEHE